MKKIKSLIKLDDKLLVGSLTKKNKLRQKIVKKVLLISNILNIPYRNDQNANCITYFALNYNL